MSFLFSPWLLPHALSKIALRSLHKLQFLVNIYCSIFKVLSLSTSEFNTVISDSLSILPHHYPLVNYFFAVFVEMNI